jgi:hypothetical protein
MGEEGRLGGGDDWRAVRGPSGGGGGRARSVRGRSTATGEEEEGGGGGEREVEDGCTCGLTYARPVF